MVNGWVDLGLKSIVDSTEVTLLARIRSTRHIELYTTSLCCIHPVVYCAPCQITFLFCPEARSQFSGTPLLLSCLSFSTTSASCLVPFSSPHSLASRLIPRPPSISLSKHVIFVPLIWRGIFTDSACNFSWFASRLHCPVAPFVSELRYFIKISHCVPVTIAISISASATGQLVSSSRLSCAHCGRHRGCWSCSHKQPLLRNI